MNFPRNIAILALLLAALGPVSARTPDRRLEQVVNSMPASGTVEIDTQGHVAGYTIKDAEAYDQALLDLMARNIQRWVFKPVLVDGVPRQARFDMYLRLQAKPLDDGKFEVSIASAAFGSKDAAAPHTRVAVRGEREPPRYPENEMRKGVGGTVLVLLRIGPDGKVMDAAVEQTNLSVVGRDGEMETWRKNLERATLAAARHWTFEPPTVGEEAGKPRWTVRTPVMFTPGLHPAPVVPGQWQRYVPGPRHALAWKDEKQTADNGVDALPAGRLYPLQQPVQLLTALNPD
jgi:TonB family protein